MNRSEIDRTDPRMEAGIPCAPSRATSKPGVAPRLDKKMAGDFLTCLDPNASKFTFQFFNDGPGTYAEIVHGTLDEVWPKIQTLNTLQQRVGVFVTINETDFSGRSSRNIVRGRALFVDADSSEQMASCIGTLAAAGVDPTMIVKTGRGGHFYFCTDVPLHQFRSLQESLIDKLGTDPAIKDLSRVMRLPGTLHLKAAEPKFVEICAMGAPACRYELSELQSKLGLSAPKAAPVQNSLVTSNFTATDRERLQRFFGPLDGSLSDGIDTNIEEIRSAVSAIPSSVISTEHDWVRFARGLAHEAAVHKGQAAELWEILDTASRGAGGYNEDDNRSRWQRYIKEAFNRDNPVTIATVFDLAKKHGRQGSSPSAGNSVSHRSATVVDPTSYKVSFSNIPHRQWLYGVDLLRGDITLLVSPGGAGKTSLALGMAVCIATGKAHLKAQIWGGADLNSLYINAEDSGIEMRRRTLAFCQRHKITEREIDRLRIAGTDAPQVRGLSFLRAAGPTSSALDQAGFKQLDSFLASMRPDLVVIDPLIALCGGGNVNDNAAMSLVMREIKYLSIKFNCAILVVHHTRKGADLGTAEAISGASSIVNLARHAIMPVTMTDAEAKVFGILPSGRRQYFKVVDAKSNHAPLTDETWYKLESEGLPNVEPPIYPHGDSVQAVTRVNLPLQSAAPNAEHQQIRRAISDLVERGKIIDGLAYPYSPSTAGSTNKRALLKDAMQAVTAATAPRQWLPKDIETVVKTTIREMKAEGELVEGDIKDLMPQLGSIRRGRGLKVAGLGIPAASPQQDAVDGAGSAAAA